MNPRIRKNYILVIGSFLLSAFGCHAVVWENDTPCMEILIVHGYTLNQGYQNSALVEDFLCSVSAQFSSDLVNILEESGISGTILFLQDRERPTAEMVQTELAKRSFGGLIQVSLDDHRNEGGTTIDLKVQYFPLVYTNEGQERIVRLGVETSDLYLIFDFEKENFSKVPISEMAAMFAGKILEL